MRKFSDSYALFFGVSVSDWDTEQAERLLSVLLCGRYSPFFRGQKRKIQSTLPGNNSPKGGPNPQNGGISECSKISHPAHIGHLRRAVAPFIPRGCAQDR